MVKRQFEVNFNIDETLQKQLEAIADPELTRRVTRSAALAGARVISERAKELAPLYAGPPKNRYSAPGKISGKVVPGELRESIYHAFTPEMSVGGKQVYSVSWNTAKVGYAHLIEFGHAVKNRKNGPVIGYAPPIPFIRGAADSTGKAFLAMRKRASERFEELIKLMNTGKPLPEFNAEG